MSIKCLRQSRRPSRPDLKNSKTSRVRLPKCARGVLSSIMLHAICHATSADLTSSRASLNVKIALRVTTWATIRVRCKLEMASLYVRLVMWKVEPVSAVQCFQCSADRSVNYWKIDRKHLRYSAGSSQTISSSRS